MNIKELFRGIVIVIDDQVSDQNSEIGKILSTLKEDEFPIVTYKNIPSKKVIQSLSSASMVILDWDFNYRKIIGEMGDVTTDEIIGLKMNEVPNQIIPFIKALLEQIFVPIFIFTNKDLSEIENSLKDSQLENQINKRIFIKSKSELREEHLYEQIKEWVENNPSVYAVKEWNIIAEKNRNQMFLDFYNAEADWVQILWKTLKKDTEDLNTNNAFGDFITKNFCNRFYSYNFEQEYMEKAIESNEGIFNILQQDAYIGYTKENAPTIPYTGDVFQDGVEYYINLRAQCDISRIRQGGKAKTALYCIKGIIEQTSKIVREYLSTIKDGDGIIKIKINNQEYTLDEAIDCEALNKQIGKAINNNFLYKHGAILEHKDFVLCPYIKKDTIIKFKLNNIYIKYFEEEKCKRIGRIVHPYLTQIQEKTANYIFRQGLMPIPEELYFFNKSDIEKQKNMD